MNYDERRAALIEYLKAKTQEADWHAVSDAANDLRVMEAGRMYISPMPPHADVRVPIDNRKSPLSEKAAEDIFPQHKPCLMFGCGYMRGHRGGHSV